MTFRTAVRLLTCATFVLLLRAPGAAAQSALTLDGLKAILVDAGKTSAQIDSLTSRVLDVSARGKALATDFQKHNAESCEYLQGHPEQCANYDRERIDLNLRLADIRKEWDGYEALRKPLRAHFAELMSKLRTATYAGATASWKESMTRCADVNGVTDASVCLTRAVANHP